MAEPKDVRQQTDDEARRLATSLIRGARYAAIAVTEPGTGHPFTARVGCASDMDGSPFILISGLAGHTVALKQDTRCALLLGEPGKGDPLAHPRISVLGRAVRVERGSDEYARLRRRYLARHPKATLYIDLPDFAFHRIEVERAALNGGFGKAYDLVTEDMILPAGELVEDLAKVEEGVVTHMNDDHSEAVNLYATVLCRQEPGAWRLASIDPTGLDLIAGDKSARLDFDAPLKSAADIRAILVQLSKDARAKLAN